MTMLLIRADFAKSYIAAHTRTLPSGKVIQVAGFSDKRYKQAMRDVKTPDMFKLDLPAPQKKIPDECARHPESCTPDLFTGETKEKQPVAHADRAQAATNTIANNDSGSAVAETLRSALRRGDISGAVSHLASLDLKQAEEALLMSGFSLGYAKNKKELMTFVQAEIVMAAGKKTDGFGLRGLTKSFPRIVFFKSHVKEYTDKNGRMVKEHDDKRTKRLAPIGPGRAAAKVEPGSAHGYGPHNVEAGDSLKFKAGDFEGGGKVKSVGQDGVTVTDASGRDHGVHWHEVVGRGGSANSGGKELPADDVKPVADAPEPPEKKEPVETKEPAADKPTNVVDIKSQKTKPDDIARALFDTSELAKLPGASQQPEHLNSWEAISKAAPQALEQFTAMLKKMSGSLDLEEGRIPSSFDLAQQEENEKAKKESREPKKLSSEKYMNPALWNNPRGFLFIGPLKKHDRALAKVKADYPLVVDGKTVGDDWSKLQDVVRATIAVPSLTQIPKVLAEMKKAGIKLAKKPKNNLIGDGLHGSGYRDLNMIVEMPNGMMCELQIHCKPITEAKEHGHEHYAENATIERKYPGGRGSMDSWAPEDRSKYEQNSKAMKSMYDAAWEKSLSSNDSDKDDLHKSLAGRIIILLKKRGTK